MLNEEQLLIQESLRGFARQTLYDLSPVWDREHRFPSEAIEPMAEMGLFGMLVDPEYGGSGFDAVSYVLAIVEIAAADGSLSTILSIHNSLIVGLIQAHGTPAQKDHYLPLLAQAKMRGCFALTEPDAGSDASAIRTRAERKGDCWVLNGSKQFISSGSTADIALVFAITDPSAGKKGMSIFLVPTDTPGYSAVRVEDKLGQHASDTCYLEFVDCEIPAENMIGQEGQGYRLALSNLENGRIGIAAQAIGMARAAFDVAHDYALNRTSFGKPLIEHQAVGFRLAELMTDLRAAELMVLDAAARKDRGEACLTEACMAKLHASEMVERVCSGAIQTLGGYGYLRDYRLEQIYRDMRVCQIYEGTSDIQKMVISRQLSK